MSENTYSILELSTDKPSNDEFHLHSHNDYEIYMFLQGDSEYVVEEKVYSLSPGDIIIIKKHEMHRIYHLSSKKYQRFVLMLSPDFFVQNGCEEFEKIFLSSYESGNKINAAMVESSGLYDAIMRFKKYSNDFIEPYTTVSKSILIEIIYLLNQVSNFENADTVNEKIKDLMHYINNNFTDKISLDSLCDKFFISKYYLCHIFKEATGLTVQQYIRDKRLVKAIALKNEGVPLTEAALQSGFENYSSFFRAFTRRYKSNPSNYKN